MKTPNQLCRLLKILQRSARFGFDSNEVRSGPVLGFMPPRINRYLILPPVAPHSLISNIWSCIWSCRHVMEAALVRGGICSGPPLARGGLRILSSSSRAISALPEIQLVRWVRLSRAAAQRWEPRNSHPGSCHPGRQPQVARSGSYRGNLILRSKS